MSAVRNRIQQGDDDRRHGTSNGYNNHGCRCQECREAHALNTFWRRRQRWARLAEDDPRHGQANTYVNHGCRCFDCRRAHTARKRATAGSLN